MTSYHDRVQRAAQELVDLIDERIAVRLGSPAPDADAIRRIAKLVHNRAFALNPATNMLSDARLRVDDERSQSYGAALRQMLDAQESLYALAQELADLAGREVAK